MTYSAIEPARAAEDDACHILDLGLCLDCINAGECFAERPVMPLEPVRDTPPLTPILSSLPIWSQLQCLHKQYADLKAHGQHIAARAVKEQAIGLVEGWFDGQDEQWLDGAAALEQIAAARAQVSATLTRWQFEAETTGIPF